MIVTEYECAWCGESASLVAVDSTGGYDDACEVCAHGSGEDSLDQTGDEKYGEPYSFYDIEDWYHGD